VKICDQGGYGMVGGVRVYHPVGHERGGVGERTSSS
jgi:hypothetical protein